jgi:hypothetical protein
MPNGIGAIAARNLMGKTHRAVPSAPYDDAGAQG